MISAQFIIGSHTENSCHCGGRRM